MVGRGERVSARLSAAADRDDDFQSVAIGYRAHRELAARHDFSVAFDRDALTRQAEMIDELGKAHRLLELTGLAIDADRDHRPFR